MKLTFDSVEECRAFVKNDLKGARAGKNDAPDTADAGQVVHQAPPPLQPPQGSPGAFAPAQFTPPVGGNAFPGSGAPQGMDPAVSALVQRIAPRIDGSIASGQPADTVLNWFRQQCGAEAAGATLDQIKTVFLPKLSVPALENIAKLMNA